MAIYIEKHKQFTPNGRELLPLVLIYKYFGGIYRDENKDLKSKLYQKKSVESRNVGLINICFIFPMGRMG